MGANRSKVLRANIWALALAFAYAALAFVSLELTKYVDGMAYVWPSSGVAVAGLLVLERRLHGLFYGLIALGSIAANMHEDSGFLTTVGFTTANLIECWIVARLARTEDGGCPRFDEPSWIKRFAIGAAVGAVVSAALATLVAGEVRDPAFFLSWSTTVLLGIFIFTPVTIEGIRFVVGWHDEEVAKPALFFKLIGFAALCALATFAQTTFPLLFMPLAAVCLSAFLLGVHGAVATVLVLAIVGTGFTAFGMGPVQFVSGPTHTKVLFFQFYLLISFACAIPMAALLAKSRKASHELMERTNLLSMAEQIAGIGHWHMEIGSGEIYWSEELFRIYGLEQRSSPLPVEDVASMYLPEDRVAVKHSLDQALVDGKPFKFSARIRRPDGTIRHIESQGMVEYSGHQPIAVFGVFIDVTDRVLAVKDLQRARNRAERQAAEARKLAETDQLTGIANRRKFIATLEQEIQAAEEHGTELSFIMFDVDHFKSINDTYGHSFGDLVLKEITEIANASLRQSDLLGRLGGEEFGVILPGADPTLAKAVGERIRSRIAMKKFDELDLVSVSLGVATFKRGADSEWLMQAADTALYQAKRDGRNRLCHAA